MVWLLCIGTKISSSNFTTRFSNWFFSRIKKVLPSNFDFNYSNCFSLIRNSKNLFKIGNYQLMITNLVFVENCIVHIITHLWYCIFNWFIIDVETLLAMFWGSMFQMHSESNDDLWGVYIKLVELKWHEFCD